MERTTEFAIEQPCEKIIGRMDLQPFQYAPFNRKPQQECGRQSNDRNPTNKFNYHISKYNFRRFFSCHGNTRQYRLCLFLFPGLLRVRRHNI